MAKSLNGQTFVVGKPKRTTLKWSTLTPKKGHKKYRGRGENANSSNDQASCFWCSRWRTCLVSLSRADWYVNPELNVGVGLDSGVGSGTTRGHVGYDFDNGAYVQAGPAVVWCSLTPVTKSLS